MTAMISGMALALVALGYVLYPLIKASPPAARRAAARDAPVPGCSACGASAEPDAVFCSSCGRPL
jgi:hypothetical protein